MPVTHIVIAALIVAGSCILLLAILIPLHLRREKRSAREPPADARRPALTLMVLEDDEWHQAFLDAFERAAGDWLPPEAARTTHLVTRSIS